MRKTDWADGCRQVCLQWLVSLPALTAQNTYTLETLLPCQKLSAVTCPSLIKFAPLEASFFLFDTVRHRSPPRPRIVHPRLLLPRLPAALHALPGAAEVWSEHVRRPQHPPSQLQQLLLLPLHVPRVQQQWIQQRIQRRSIWIWVRIPWIRGAHATRDTHSVNSVCHAAGAPQPVPSLHPGAATLGGGRHDGEHAHTFTAIVRSFGRAGGG